MPHYSPLLRAQLSQYRKRKHIPLGGAPVSPRPHYHGHEQDAATFYARQLDQSRSTIQSIYDAPAEYQWDGPKYEPPPSWFEGFPPPTRFDDHLRQTDPLDLTPHPPNNDPDGPTMDDIWRRLIDWPSDAIANETITYDSDHELTQAMFDHTDMINRQPTQDHISVVEQCQISRDNIQNTGVAHWCSARIPRGTSRHIQTHPNT